MSGSEIGTGITALGLAALFSWLVGYLSRYKRDSALQQVDSHLILLYFKMLFLSL